MTDHQPDFEAEMAFCALLILTLLILRTLFLS